MDIAPKLNRRTLLTATAGFAVAGLSIGRALSASLSGIENAALRGSISATDLGVRTGSGEDQSRAFGKMLNKASRENAQVFLPAGTYVVSKLSLPARVRLVGVPGASRIVYGGGGQFFVGANAEHIELTGLVFDGANQWIADGTQALLDLKGVRHLVIDNCLVSASSKNGVALERAAGRIERSTISGAADAGLWSVEGGGLSITGNTVSDCGNGGILVHRWKTAEDGTIVSGNRDSRCCIATAGRSRRPGRA